MLRDMSCAERASVLPAFIFYVYEGFCQGQRASLDRFYRDQSDGTCLAVQDVRDMIYEDSGFKASKIATDLLVYRIAQILVERPDITMQNVAESVGYTRSSTMIDSIRRRSSYLHLSHLKNNAKKIIKDTEETYPYVGSRSYKLYIGSTIGCLKGIPARSRKSKSDGDSKRDRRRRQAVEAIIKKGVIDIRANQENSYGNNVL